MRHLQIAALLGLCVAAPAFAHEPRPGPNGGLKVDAGNMHAELLADGSKSVIIYLFDANDAPVKSEGFKANAILIIDGKVTRFSLEPAGETTLSGQAPVPVAKGVKGAIQITLPDGSSVQAKY